MHCYKKLNSIYLVIHFLEIKKILFVLVVFRERGQWLGMMKLGKFWEFKLESNYLWLVWNWSNTEKEYRAEGGGEGWGEMQRVGSIMCKLVFLGLFLMLKAT